MTIMTNIIIRLKVRVISTIDTEVIKRKRVIDIDLDLDSGFSTSLLGRNKIKCYTGGEIN